MGQAGAHPGAARQQLPALAIAVAVVVAGAARLLALASLLRTWPYTATAAAAQLLALAVVAWLGACPGGATGPDAGSSSRDSSTSSGGGRWVISATHACAAVAATWATCAALGVGGVDGAALSSTAALASAAAARWMLGTAVAGNALLPPRWGSPAVPGPAASPRLAALLPTPPTHGPVSLPVLAPPLSPLHPTIALIHNRV